MILLLPVVAFHIILKISVGIPILCMLKEGQEELIHVVMITITITITIRRINYCRKSKISITENGLSKIEKELARSSTMLFGYLNLFYDGIVCVHYHFFNPFSPTLDMFPQEVLFLTILLC